ncbi:helix-turn-helix domain-containing protein [Mesorhizobium hungaricum]|jgi:transcriptional regulator with XRE-family HTH domain|uniref:helix-turn-helix domain-containing protein n=1 Tax=Mesorhizobium TaxID=68287 RepID=UPI0009F28A7B|nr:MULTISPECIES: helix-turn-helix transcriptional regulator [Mesorhizobium]MBN9236032.1 helix-turn-helix transcriptional regulator [Mesorhizobium sp.]
MSDLDIKQIRADRGLTQRELADLAGVNLSTVWRWENGKPPRGTARALLLQMAGETPISQEERVA